MARWMVARAFFPTIPGHPRGFRVNRAHNREGLGWVAKLTPTDGEQNEGRARLKPKFFYCEKQKIHLKYFGPQNLRVSLLHATTSMIKGSAELLFFCFVLRLPCLIAA